MLRDLITVSANFDPNGEPKKPGALCIGAQKAGTSWLAQMLGQHPQVWIPPFKEVQFFNYRYLPGHQYWIKWHYKNKPREIRERHIKREVPMPPELDAYLDGLTSGQMFHNQWYKRVFAPAPKNAVPMDFTPEYSTVPEEGVEFMARFLRKAKVIYLIRHPVDRAISQLRMNLRREKRSPKSVADWFEEVRNPVLFERGDYATYLPRWQKHFPDMQVIPFGRIARQPGELMDEIEEYLGIDPYPYGNLEKKVFANPEGLNPPAEAVELLGNLMRPQLDFLKAEFGEDFVNDIR